MSDYLDPYKNINFVERHALIEGKKGEIIYDKKVIFPDYFSDNSVNIVSSKYFCKSIENEETDIRQMINRVSETIGIWGEEQDYFETQPSLKKFIYNLKYFQVHQMVAFNSPVYFNMGVNEKVQASACFILDVKDDMESITNVMNKESKIFKRGSGSGMNLSALRSKYENINNQTGYASGPVSFLKVHDILASVIRSGGSLRRSAKLACLNIDHPDIEDFIDCKKFEEEKLNILRNSGIESRPGCELSDEVFFQSTNLSVRVSDDFMEKVVNDETWETKFVTNGQVHKTYKARDLLLKIAQRTWEMGDPGIQFDDTVNSWNTVSNDGRISSSNPCLPLWVPVLTPDGYKKFGDIKNKVYLNGEKDCSDLIKTSDLASVFEIELKNGMCVYATENHKISTNFGDIQLKDLDIEKHKVSMCYQKIPYIFDQDEFEKGFLSGYLYSEGSLFEGLNGKLIANFCIGAEEFDLEENITSLLKKHIKDLNTSDIIFKPHFQKPNTCKTLTINKKSSIKDIIDIFKSESKNNFNLFNHTMSFQKGFIEAFITFDGYCSDYKYKEVLKACQSGSRGLKILKQIQLSLASFGIYSNISISNHEKDIIRNGKVNHYQTSYNLSINDMWEFSKIFNIYSTKKHDKLQKIIKTPKKHPSRLTNIKTYQAINNIRKISEEPVYDINVPDGNHFVTGGAVVHNCGEYLFLNNSSCNLAAINLVKFFDFENKTFNFDLFTQVIETIITAQDIIINKAEYPTLEVFKNSMVYRPLGLGYTNLGALLMLLGIPYDSDEGRLIASYITALLTGIAYETSSQLAEFKGPFERFTDNKKSFYGVLQKHYYELINIKEKYHNLHQGIIKDLMLQSLNVWENVRKKESFRNAQVSLLAPTGTTSLLLGAQTTGIEPEFSHVKYKRLSNTDGSIIKMTSDVTKKCLENLNYNKKDIEEIECYITDDKSLDLCRCFKQEHKGILNTSVSKHKDQTIHYSGHIRMLGAVQPFLSGGISKTITFSNDCKVEDIFKCYVECWKLGLKGVAIYRDGSKNFQPLTSSKNDDDDDDFDTEDMKIGDLQKDDRLVKYMHSILAQRKLPEERPAINHKFTVDRVKGYLNMGMFENGELGEIFITISKEGSTLSGLIDCLATLTSISLQRGVPLKDIVEKMIWQKFEPAGFCSNKKIRTATSIVDYIFKYIGMYFLSKEDQVELGLISNEEDDSDDDNFEDKKVKSNIVRNLNNNFAGSGKICSICGGLTILKGICYVCTNCGDNGSCG